MGEICQFTKAQVALSVADKSLPESAPKQQRADTRAGRSRLVFSKAADIINVSDTFNLDYNAKDKLLETFIGEKSFNLKTEEGVKEFNQYITEKIVLSDGPELDAFYFERNNGNTSRN